MERHMTMGKSAWEAAFDSADEVGLAVIASSSTIVAVFLPVAFMGGIPGQFFQPFGVTVAVSTIFSTFVARMVTPMMGAYLLENKQGPRGRGGINIKFLNFKFTLFGSDKGTKKTDR